MIKGRPSLDGDTGVNDAPPAADAGEAGTATPLLGAVGVARALSAMEANGSAAGVAVGACVGAGVDGGGVADAGAIVGAIVGGVVTGRIGGRVWLSTRGVCTGGEGGGDGSGVVSAFADGATVQPPGACRSPLSPTKGMGFGVCDVEPPWRRTGSRSVSRRRGDGNDGVPAGTTHGSEGKTWGFSSDGDVSIIAFRETSESPPKGLRAFGCGPTWFVVEGVRGNETLTGSGVVVRGVCVGGAPED